MPMMREMMSLALSSLIELLVPRLHERNRTERLHTEKAALSTVGFETLSYAIPKAAPADEANRPVAAFWFTNSTVCKLLCYAADATLILRARSRKRLQRGCQTRTPFGSAYSDLLVEEPGVILPRSRTKRTNTRFV